MPCTRWEKDKKNKLQVTQPPPGCSNTRELIMIYLQCTAESWSKTSSVKRLVTSASCLSPWVWYVLALSFSVRLFAPQSVVIMCLELCLRLLFWFDNLHSAPICPPPWFPEWCVKKVKQCKWTQPWFWLEWYWFIVNSFDYECVCL